MSVVISSPASTPHPACAFVWGPRGVPFVTHQCPCDDRTLPAPAWLSLWARLCICPSCGRLLRPLSRGCTAVCLSVTPYYPFMQNNYVDESRVGDDFQLRGAPAAAVTRVKCGSRSCSCSLSLLRALRSTLTLLVSLARQSDKLFPIFPRAQSA